MRRQGLEKKCNLTEKRIFIFFQQYGFLIQYGFQSLFLLFKGDICSLSEILKFYHSFVIGSDAFNLRCSDKKV